MGEVHDPPLMQVHARNKYMYPIKIHSRSDMAKREITVHQKKRKTT